MSSTIDEKFYKTFYDNSPILFRTVDKNGKIIICNNAYANALGYSIPETIGSSIFDHVSGDFVSDMKEIFRQWCETGQVKDREIWLKRKDESSFPGLLSATNLYDEQGMLIGSVTAIRDNSDVYDYKEQITSLKKQRLTVLGELTSRIAHDFRNPISIIKNSIELAELKNCMTDPECTRYFSMIKKATTRISHQVNEVLGYVTPQDLEIKPHSIYNIIQTTVERITVPSSVKLSIPVSNVMVDCDSEQLEIVFANLILNAIQAMEDRGKIDITIHDRVDHVIIDIKDEGPGIPPDILPEIFEPLFTTRQIGTGLGLPSCKNIVEKHGGAITVDTELGRGTTFSIKLPKTAK